MIAQYVKLNGVLQDHALSMHSDGVLGKLLPVGLAQYSHTNEEGETWPALGRHNLEPQSLLKGGAEVGDRDQEADFYRDGDDVAVTDLHARSAATMFVGAEVRAELLDEVRGSELCRRAAWLPGRSRGRVYLQDRALE